MEYKDYVHEELENGKVRLLAQIGVDIEVPKEECEKLSVAHNPAEIGLLVQEWIQKGYVKTTARGDSYFVDCKWADHEYFDLEHKTMMTGIYEKENVAKIDSGSRIIKVSAGLTQEYEVFKTNAPDEMIIEQIRENNRMSEEGVFIENPYGVLEKNGYSVEILGCQDDDDFMGNIVIDAEFDAYQIKTENSFTSLDEQIKGATCKTEKHIDEQSKKNIDKEMGR